MRHHRPLARTVALMAALLATGPVASASASTHRADVRRTASSLTRQLLHAHSDRSRERALLRIARSLHAGVYTGSGRAIVRAPKGGTRVWLYRDELTALASGLGRGDTITLDALAADLAKLGVRAEAGPITGAQLGAALEAGVRHAHGAKGLAAALIGAMATRSHRSLSGPGAALDPLQAWLVRAEFAATAKHVQRTSPRTVRRSAAAARAGVKQCFAGQDRLQKAYNEFGKISGALGDTVKLIVNLVPGAMHASNLAVVIQIDATKNGQSSQSHWGPGHDSGDGLPAGAQMSFQIGAQMVESLPDRLIRCGELAGLTIPKKGPVAGLPVNWDGLGGDWGILMNNAIVVRKDDATGADGTATLVVQPKAELVPGIGTLRTDIGHLFVAVDVNVPLGANLGFIYDVLEARTTEFPFTVNRHQARGYTFTSTSQVICFALNGCASTHHVDASYAYTATVCGADPYAADWNGSLTLSSTDIFNGAATGPPETVVEPISFRLVPGQASEVRRPDFLDRNDNAATFQLFPGPPATMRVETHASNSFTPGGDLYRSYGDVEQVAITEAPPGSCPG